MPNRTTDRPAEASEQAAQLAAPCIEHARDDLARMHIQTDPRTLSHNRRLPLLRLYRRAHPDGNPRQLGSDLRVNNAVLRQCSARTPEAGLADGVSERFVPDS